MISEQLKQAIRESGLTHYRLAKETGINARILDRFMSGEQEGMQSRLMDPLCAFLGLELCKGKRAGKSAGTAVKQGRKSSGTARAAAATKGRKGTGRGRTHSPVAPKGG